MNTSIPSLITLLSLAFVPVGNTMAQTPALASHVTLGAGGGSGSTANYSNLGSLGAVSAGKSTARTEDVLLTSSPGFLGSVYAEKELLILIRPEIIVEGQEGQLEATLVLEDDTTVALAGDEVAWAVLQESGLTVDDNGRVQTVPVYTDQEAGVQGDYRGLRETVRFQVANDNPDNYGRYAGDQLPDDWQVSNFGENNPNASPSSDADQDHQNNDYEFRVGTDPNNPESFFRFAIFPAPGAPDQKHLVFSPVFPDRRYTVEYQPSIGEGEFMELEQAIQTDADQERTVTDLSAVDPRRIYRVRIVFPTGGF